MLELPRYLCHKEVGAAKITSIQRGMGASPTLQLDTGDVVGVSQAWLDRFTPVAGGYYVVYDDGYASFSPAEPFEAGYTQVEGA